MSPGNFDEEMAPNRGVHINVGSGNQNNNCGSGKQFVVGVMNMSSEQRDSLLCDLSTTDPGDDKKRIVRTKGGLIPGLNNWFFDHEEYNRWHRKPEKRLLWITGSPGKGKTMLICDVIEELEKQNYEPVYFFCEAGDTRLNMANAVLRGLLYSFLSRNPSCISQIQEKYERRGKVVFEDTNSWDVLTGMIKDIISSGAMSKAVIVIDALDECVEELGKLLDLLIDISATCKAIVSSRSCLHIKDSLATACDKITISLENNEPAVSGAVRSFIDRKVSELAASKGYDDTKHAEIFTYLNANANNTFLWVSLVCQQLKNSVPFRHTIASLKEFHSGLDSIYDRMCSRVIQLSGESLCAKLLATICILRERLVWKQW
ncbi:vegetative incompatibility protein HET-E-1 [Colletotrichum chrysophilum]|uniref:Vegetative incompatibility protein HET-E-1 n=1 Tax=Colletotrichum chrysophilum TaxID=1836956 RepID=A0AAD9AVY4_9PEZI|nr:vegetative incompatibility protein HET-E-1 [Colletotrichum chrysophilum]